MGCEHGELLLHLGRAATGAGRGLANTDELLEVLLTAHADVFVDRHLDSQIITLTEQNSMRDLPQSLGRHTRLCPKLLREGHSGALEFRCPVSASELEPQHMRFVPATGRAVRNLPCRRVG